MALSITQAGTGNSTTSGTTFSVTPTVSFAVNDTVVVCSAHDNLFSGAPYISSVTDSQGNTYSLAAGNKTQGGSGADRATVAIYRCNVTTALSTSDTITITFSGSLAAKAVVLYKISAASNKKASLRLAAAATPLPSTTNFSGGSPTMVNGEALIRALAIEDSQTVTGDSDTTRGSWSAAYSATALGASATASMQIFTQTKIVTANGTQTWDVTFTSADTATAYGIFEEVAAFAVLSRTATGSGTGSQYASIPANPSPSDVTDFQFSFRNTPGFYLGPSTVTRTATGSGTGAGSATRKIVVVRTATGSGTGISNNAIVVGRLRTGYGSGGATAGDTATILVIKVRTATGSGAGASSVIYLEKLARTATASGSSTSAIVVLHVAPRTATSGGTGSSSSTRILIAFRTGTGAGTGTQASVGARALRRTCTASGSGASTNVNWEKSHIFRVPYTDTYPGGYFGGGNSANRLRRYDRSNVRGLNLYKLTDGSYTTVEQRNQGQVAKLWHGGRNHFLTDDEVAELTAAGYGDYIT